MEKLQDMLNSTVHVCTNLTNDFILKCTGALVLFIAELSFGPVGLIPVFCVMILIVLDSITGLAGAKLSGQELTSKKFFNTPIKFVFFPLMIAAGSITETAIGTSFLMIPQLITGYLAIHELLSNVENFGKMGFHIPQKILNREQLTNLISKK